MSFTYVFIWFELLMKCYRFVRQGWTMALDFFTRDFLFSLRCSAPPLNFVVFLFVHLVPLRYFSKCHHLGWERGGAGWERLTDVIPNQQWAVSPLAQASQPHWWIIKVGWQNISCCYSIQYTFWQMHCLMKAFSEPKSQGFNDMTEPAQHQDKKIQQQQNYLCLLKLPSLPDDQSNPGVTEKMLFYDVYLVWLAKGNNDLRKMCEHFQVGIWSIRRECSVTNMISDALLHLNVTFSTC